MTCILCTGQLDVINSGVCSECRLLIDNRMTTDRYLVACHEAGHAVAALMRGGEVLSISIDATDEHRGYTLTRIKPCEAAFFTYAGPWAEARAQWTKPLDGEDDDGSTFDDYVAGAFERNADGDLREYLRFSLADAAVFGDLNTWLTYASEKTWSSELEAKWPLIRQVAELLIGGANVTVEMVLGLLG